MHFKTGIIEITCNDSPKHDQIFYLKKVGGRKNRLRKSKSKLHILTETVNHEPGQTFSMEYCMFVQACNPPSSSNAGILIHFSFRESSVAGKWINV